MTSGQQQARLANQVSRDTIAWLLRTILRLPKNWLRASVFLAILSLFDVSWTQASGLAYSFRVTNTTVLFLAVVWLPALLQIFALVGGAIRTPAGELSSPGIEQLLQLVDPETKEEAIGALKVVLERAEESVPLAKRLEVRQAQQQLDEEYLSTISSEQARQELNHLAQRYQKLREAPSGTRRNFLVEALAGVMRALTPKAQLSEAEINAHLQSQHQGQRIVGISSMEALQDPKYFELALEVIAHPKSAFEQTYALRAVEKMLPNLAPNEKKRLRQVLEKQRDFDPTKQQWIKPGSDRWSISDRLLSALDISAPV